MCMHPDLDGYWLFFGRVDENENWFFHAPVPPDTTRDNFDFQSLLHKAVGAEFKCELEHIGFWDLRFAVADSYRNSTRVHRRRCSAQPSALRWLRHQHRPRRRRNLGMEAGGDAARLGRRAPCSIAIPLSASQSLLRPRGTSSQTSSRPIGNSFAKFDPALDKAAFEAAWELRQAGAVGEIQSFEPNYEGSPIVFGPPGGHCSAVGSHSFEARAGSSSRAPATLLRTQRVRGAGRWLHAAGLWRR